MIYKADIHKPLCGLRLNTLRNETLTKGGIILYLRRTISILGAALSVGVCVFITYISREADSTTILFNLVFLGVMLLMTAAACFSGLRRLIQTTCALKRASDKIRQTASKDAASWDDPSAPLFQNAFLDDCFHQYRSMAAQNPSSVCDIRSFINEDAIETYVHRGILENIPDILTSLGILGTFVGLVMGLREFDPSGYEQMAGSVTPLINGIKVAFITSIYGIALSLSFSFNLRSEFSNLSARIDEFLDTYYLHVQPPYEIDSLGRLLSQQKSQEDMVHDLTGIFVEQMASSFEQAITPAFARMTEGFQQVADTFTSSQEELLTNVCNAVTRQMRTELLSDFNQITKTVAELTKTQASYTDFMDHTISRIQKTLASLQDSMTQTQNYLTDSVEKLAEAQTNASRVNQEQKESYQDYIRFMYQTIEKFSEIWEKNSEEIKGYSDQIAKMGPVQSSAEMRLQLSKITDQLQKIQQEQVLSSSKHNSEQDSEQTQELLERTLTKLDELSRKMDQPVLFRRRKK